MDHLAKITAAILSKFLNHYNGAEGTLDSGDFLQIQVRQAKGVPGLATLETNKQTNMCYM